MEDVAFLWTMEGSVATTELYRRELDGFASQNEMELRTCPVVAEDVAGAGPGCAGTKATADGTR